MNGVVFVLIALGAYVGLVLFIAEFCAEQEAPTPPFKPLHRDRMPSDWSEAERRWREHTGIEGDVA